MTRQSPAGPPEVNPATQEQLITQTRSYRLITPLFGGGEEPGKEDSVTVVRASEIRGHLRFWWRALRGGTSKGNLETMRKLEEEIWGSSSGKDKDGIQKPGPSRITVQVVSHHPGIQIKKQKKPIRIKGEDKIVDIGDPRADWGYVAFPLREEREGGRVKKEAGAVREDVTFKIKLTYPTDISTEIEAALWAWETFGGIGARTRRGFGALCCVEAEGKPEPIQISQAAIPEMIDAKLAEYGIPGPWPPGVPYLSPTKTSYAITGDAVTPPIAWEILIAALRQFRQEKARVKDGRGASHWPEPNAIRRKLGRSPHSPDNEIDKYPRAAFGLPIPFHMKHDGELHLSLEGALVDRLASPLIMRPIACTEGAVGIALILAWRPKTTDQPPFTPPGGLKIKGNASFDVPATPLTKPEALQIPPLNGEPNVLEAFLDFLSAFDNAGISAKQTKKGR